MHQKVHLLLYACFNQCTASSSSVHICGENGEGESKEELQEVQEKKYPKAEKNAIL